MSEGVVYDHLTLDGVPQAPGPAAEDRRSSGVGDRDLQTIPLGCTTVD
jgi:hypothetical protein